MVAERIGKTGFDYMVGNTSKTDTQNGLGFADEISKAQSVYREDNKKNSGIETESSEKPQKNEFVEKEKPQRTEMSVDEKEFEDEVTTEVDVSVMEAFADLLNQLKEQVMEMISKELGVDVTQVSQAMEDLGLNVFDLQDSQNLMKLMVSLKELSGPAEVLTSQELTQAFKTLDGEIGNLLEGAEELPKEVLQEEVPQEPTTQENIKEEIVLPENTSQEDDAETQMQDSHREGESNQNTNLNQPEGMQVNQTSVTDYLQVALEERVDKEVSTSILRQVSSQIQVQMKSDVTSLEMQLYPEHLGKVSIQVASKNGVVTAQITAESETAKAALLSQMELLKESLNTQGLKVESIEVMVASKGFEQENGQAGEQTKEQTGQNKKSRKVILEELLQEREPEEVLNETLGNTVSYMA